jgi:hypothetical protein
MDNSDYPRNTLGDHVLRLPPFGRRPPTAAQPGIARRGRVVTLHPQPMLLIGACRELGVAASARIAKIAHVAPERGRR